MYVYLIVIDKSCFTSRQSLFQLVKSELYQFFDSMYMYWYHFYCKMLFVPVINMNGSMDQERMTKHFKRMNLTLTM